MFAYGAPKDKKLGIPGEDALQSVYSAREFVGWYNGLPEHRDLAPNLTAGEDAVIIGQGNVALDVARILLSDVNRLRETDIADYALDALSRSKIKRVRVVGRRGPLQVCIDHYLLTPYLTCQASFTIKEVRELLQLPSVSFDPIPHDLLDIPQDVLSNIPRAQKRLIQLLAKGSTNDPATATKSWSLDFLLSPECLNWSPTHPYRLSDVRFSRNELDPSDPYLPSSKVTPKYLSNGQRAMVNLPANTFFRSVGYKSLALAGLEDLGVPFDDSRGVIPNDGFGRVTVPPASEAGVQDRLPDSSVISHLPGLYCAGWVKRGPTGVIATTMNDAFSTADAIAEDAASSGGTLLTAADRRTGLGWEGVRADAGQPGLRATSWEDWGRIDRAERELGSQRNKSREKFGRVEEMLEVL